MRFAVNSYVPFLIPQTDDPYETVCDGCQTACDRCSFDEPPLVPACSEVMEHAVSPGGVVTLEMLEIEPGYWRATETSTDILACYNEDACLGGVTGAAGNCLEGYEGPCEYFRVGVRAVRERSSVLRDTSLSLLSASACRGDACQIRGIICGMERVLVEGACSGLVGSSLWFFDIKHKHSNGMVAVPARALYCGHSLNRKKLSPLLFLCSRPPANAQRAIWLLGTPEATRGTTCSRPPC